MARSFTKPRLKTASPVVRKKPSLDFSITGLVYCSMMMFMGLAAINSQANLLFAVFGLMIGVLLVSGMISEMMLRKLLVERQLPEHGVVGQPMTLIYHMRNGKRFWPSLSVTAAEIDSADAFTKQPQAYLLHCASQMEALVPTEMIPVRRGVHEFNRHQLITSFPFGFIKRAADRSVRDSLLVHPAIGKVDQRLINQFRSAELTGTQIRPRPGGNDEFYGVKEYRFGENPRWIYWRRSARTGSLVIREMTEVSPPKVLMLIDTFLDDPTPTAQVGVERVIAIAASLASEALEQGLSIGALAWDGRWNSMAINRGKRHRRDLLSFISQLPLNTTAGTSALIDQSYAQSDSETTLVLISRTEVSLSFGESVRGSLIVIPVDSPQAKRWFTFDPNIDFSKTMPLDQQLLPSKKG